MRNISELGEFEKGNEEEDRGRGGGGGEVG